uniref:AUP1 lipid droplet regulating VLDL assembly factor n=1 Tax=Chelydra serpentina TaxID=8475 RepID=A0A8C3S5N2_CHESE
MSRSQKGGLAWGGGSRVSEGGAGRRGLLQEAALASLVFIQCSSKPILVTMGLGVSVPVVRFIVRVMCSVLGLFVRQSDTHLRDANVRVYIANHVTHFDHSVINLLTSCNTPALNGTPGFICWSRGFMELGAVGSRAELVDSLKVYSSHGGNPPLLLFPEEAATNGRVGLLRFSSWPFSILDMIQPVALQVQRPLIAVSVADSSWITELLWTFFVPFTVYQVRYYLSLSFEEGGGAGPCCVYLTQSCRETLLCPTPGTASV